MNKLKNAVKNLLPAELYAVLIVSAALTATVGLIYCITGTQSNLVWIIASVLCAAAVLIIRKVFSRTDDADDEKYMTSLIEGANLTLITKLPYPVFICNQEEEIIWANAEFKSRHGKIDVIKKTTNELFGFSVKTIGDEAQGVKTVSLGRYTYIVRRYAFEAKEVLRHIIFFEDTTSLTDEIKLHADDDVQIALVATDNLGELAEYTKESTRRVAGKIEELLVEWAASADGIIREYQSDRYIVLVRTGKMQIFTDSKFDILDKIREIRIGDINMSATVSIGVSMVGGTLPEKERIATEALDMALQRGGDQVVMKSAKDMKFFGGRSQSIQKRTRVRSRVVANELASLISSSSHVIIMGHKNPDFDSIGACIGIARLCSYCIVPFSVVADEENPNVKKCFEKITSLTERPENFIVNRNDAQELVDDGILTVIVDVNNNALVEAPSVVEISRRNVYIDHHRRTGDFDEQPILSYIEPSASSACELVAEVLEQAMPSGKLGSDVANILYAGMLLDTNRFTKNTGVRTFTAAQYLRDEGASPPDALLLFSSDLPSVMEEAEFETNVSVYKGCFAISHNGSGNPESVRVSAAKAADKLLTVENINASFALCSVEGHIHISARSNGSVNVQLIMEMLGGGGHFDSAAVQLEVGMEDAVRALQNAIDKYLSENSSDERNV